MSFLDLLWMSWLNLRRRKLRTFLTVLGVVIGSASIVVMISLGIGLQNSMYSEMEEFGGATLVKVYSSEGDNYFGDYEDESEEDANNKKNTVFVDDEAIMQLREMEHVASAEPVYSLQTLILKGKYEADIELIGMTPSGLESKKMEFADGGLPEKDSNDIQLVFGNQVITSFYDKKSDDNYWSTGKLPDVDLMHDSLFLILNTEGYYNNQYNDGSSFGDGLEGFDDGESGAATKPAKKHSVKGCGLVAGTLEEYNGTSFNVFCDLETLIRTVKKEFGSTGVPGQVKNKKSNAFQYSFAEVRVDKAKNVGEVTKKLRELGYNVDNNAEELESVKREMSIVEAVLGGIGAISLLVAAIGIANTMMMSIYERTKEIGVMKVLGCSMKNIQQMFLMEAAFIGFIGGVVGNAISFVISFIINRISSNMGDMGSKYDISTIPIWLVLTSLLFAVTVGVLAGFFPSRRAMKLSALDAIRNS